VPTPEQLAGPTGAIILLVAMIGGLVWVIKLLWADHLKAIADDRAQRDKAMALLETALDANRAHAIAEDFMAKAWDERNRADAVRRRRNDAKP
jgi:hypothetical protein